MKSHNIAAIIQREGTILKTSRNKEFMNNIGLKQAFENLQKNNTNALVVIDRDGSFKGATTFSQRFKMPIVSLPGTIDNDIYGTDVTIEYNTALNTVVEAVDKIRNTTSSHNRIFFVEVMGHKAGSLKLRAGLACGAEAILIPEIDSDIAKFIEYLKNNNRCKKSSNIILVAKGEKESSTFKIVKKLQPYLHNFDVRVSIGRHIQRGGSPSAYDQFISTKMRINAIKALLNKQYNIMIGIHNEKIVHIPIEKTIKLHKTIDLDKVQMIN